MNPYGRSTFRRFAALGALLGARIVAAAEAFAQEPGGGVTTPAAIEAARREFEAVNSLRNLGPESARNTPALAVPRLPSDAAPSSTSGATGTVPRRGPASSAWLIEAMEVSRKPSEARTTGANDGAIRPAKEPGGFQPAGAGTPEGRTINGRSGNGSVNPFLRYLGQWMSPQDYALLRPALEPAGGGALASTTLLREVNAQTHSVGTVQAPGVPPPAADDARPTRGSSGQEVRSNPYLEAVVPARGTVSSSSGTAQATSPSVVIGSSTAGATNAKSRSAEAMIPAPPGQSPATRIPEFIRPDSDDRYFKPLKRF